MPISSVVGLSAPVGRTSCINLSMDATGRVGILIVLEYACGKSGHFYCSNHTRWREGMLQALLFDLL